MCQAGNLLVALSIPYELALVQVLGMRIVLFLLVWYMAYYYQWISCGGLNKTRESIGSSGCGG